MKRILANIVTEENDTQYYKVYLNTDSDSTLLPIEEYNLSSSGAAALVANVANIKTNKKAFSGTVNTISSDIISADGKSNI